MSERLPWAMEELKQLQARTFPRRFFVYLILYGGMWLFLVVITAILFPQLQRSSFFLGAGWAMLIGLAFDIWRFVKDRRGQAGGG